MHFASIDQTEFTARAATILVEEGIEFELDMLDTYVKVTYPDLRSCIKLLQSNSIDGKLIDPRLEDSGVSDYKIEMVELFKKRKIKEARTLLCGRARPDEMEGIYRWLYDNLDLLGDSEEAKDSAVLIIKQGLVDHALVADPEINLSATLIKLARLQLSTSKKLLNEFYYGFSLIVIMFIYEENGIKYDIRYHILDL
jgi:DNA polymerase III delta prime subunit